MERSSSNHDIVVIGASAGGLEALRRLLGDLPASLPASLFIVVHLGAASHLAQILDRMSVLPVVSAETGVSFQHGRDREQRFEFGTLSSRG